MAFEKASSTRRTTPAPRPWTTRCAARDDQNCRDRAAALDRVVSAWVLTRQSAHVEAPAPRLRDFELTAQAGRSDRRPGQDSGTPFPVCSRPQRPDGGGHERFAATSYHVASPVGRRAGVGWPGRLRAPAGSQRPGQRSRRSRGTGAGAANLRADRRPPRRSPRTVSHPSEDRVWACRRRVRSRGEVS